MEGGLAVTPWSTINHLVGKTLRTDPDRILKSVGVASVGGDFPPCLGCVGLDTPGFCERRSDLAEQEKPCRCPKGAVFTWDEQVV